MPESTTDRPTKSHEYVFLLAKRERYFFDQEAVREPHQTPDGMGWAAHGRGVKVTQDVQKTDGDFRRRSFGGYPSGRNIRSVWTLATEPYPDSHFAVFPRALPERCIKAGTSERGACATCGAPWERTRAKIGERPSHSGSKKPSELMLARRGAKSLETSVFADGMLNVYQTTGWRPTCACKTQDTVPCVVLDPFAGSGTTLQVAEQLGRAWFGIDLSEQYRTFMARRTAQRSLLARR